MLGILGPLIVPPTRIRASWPILHQAAARTARPGKPLTTDSAAATCHRAEPRAASHRLSVVAVGKVWALAAVLARGNAGQVAALAFPGVFG